MRYLIVIAGMLSVAVSAPAAKLNYTLYYLDSANHVSMLRVSVTGKKIGNPKVLSRHKYDAFSVSPDGKRLLGFVAAGRRTDVDTGNVFVDYRTYIERIGGTVARQELTGVSGMPDPDVNWLPDTDHLLVQRGYFDLDYDLYNIRTRRTVLQHLISPPAVSADGRFLVATRGGDEGYLLVDLKTELKSSIEKDLAYFVWCGDGHRLAWDDGIGVTIGYVKATGAGPAIMASRVLAKGSFADLRYTPGKGLYWLSPGANRAYCSRDTTSVKVCPVLPREGVDDGGVSRFAGRKDVDLFHIARTADRALIAAPVRKKNSGLPTITVFDRLLKPIPLASGTHPAWAPR